MKKESFVFYETWADAIRHLPDNERLQLYDAIMDYGIYGEKTVLGGIAQMALNLIFNDIDECKARRMERAEKNRENIRKRWNKSNTNVYERIQSDTKHSVDVDVNGDVNVNVNGYVNVDSNIDSGENENFAADKSATNKPQPKTIEERKNEFMQLVADNGVEKYGQEMCRDFFDYWTESNPNGKKMRFEMQKVFDVKRRLATWNSNNFKTNKNGNQRSNGDIPIERIVEAGRAWANTIRQ